MKYSLIILTIISFLINKINCSSNEIVNSFNKVFPIAIDNSTSGGFIVLDYGNLTNDITLLNTYSENIKVIANNSILCSYNYINNSTIRVYIPNGLYCVDISLLIYGKEIFETNIIYDKAAIEEVTKFQTTGTFNLTIYGTNFGEPFILKSKEYNNGQEISNCTLLLSTISGNDFDIITCFISINSNTNIDGDSGYLELYVGPNKITTEIYFVFDRYSFHSNDKAILIPIMVFTCFIVLVVSILIMLYIKKNNNQS